MIKKLHMLGAENATPEPYKYTVRETQRLRNNADELFGTLSIHVLWMCGYKPLKERQHGGRGSRERAGRRAL